MARKKGDVQAHVQTVAFKAESNDIVDTAVAAGSFKTLVAAVQAAGLFETLKGAGPLTVFATASIDEAGATRSGCPPAGRKAESRAHGNHSRPVFPADLIDPTYTSGESPATLTSRGRSASTRRF